MKEKIISIILACMMLTPTVFAAPSPSPKVTPSVTSKADINTTKADKKSNEVKNDSADEGDFPTPHCESAIVIDRKSGDILYEKSKSKKMYPASTTKIMTAILALELGNLSDIVVATREAIEPITLKHSNMGLKVDEVLTLEQLLYGLLVYSANDAANVIGVHLAGSLAGFNDMMNSKAAELGLKGTHFENAHGYHDDNHYTTAEDLAIVTRYAMQNEKFCEIVNTYLYRIPANDKYTEERVLSTTNHLISRYRNVNYYYKYAVGVKTGHTDEAGACLVSAATKGDIELICVILKADESDNGTLYSFADSKMLFEHAFENFQYCSVASVEKVVSDSPVYEAKNSTRVALSPAENIDKLLPNSANPDDIIPEIVLNEKIKAPIKKGDTLGNVTYMYHGKELGSTTLVAVNDVEHDKILALIHFILNIITSPFFIIAAIIIIYLMISSNIKRKRRRRKRRSRLKYANQPRKR